VNPTNGRRENRNRIPRAVIGFSNAVLVSGDMKYADAWRNMMDSINSHVRDMNGRKQYPSMYGADGWYGWQNTPWNVGALELWFWSQKAEDANRLGNARQGWVNFLQGQNPDYPELALQRDFEIFADRTQRMRDYKTPPDRRLADNMLDLNPATTGALIQLMCGGIPPGADGSLLNARLRYFDPDRKRAGVPEDVAALVSEMTDTQTVVTLINLNATQPRTVIVQGGGYGEHQLVSVTAGGKTTAVNSPLLKVQLDPGCGQKLVLEMKRYVNAPTVLHPWQRKA
jgi:hypothetical protein